MLRRKTQGSRGTPERPNARRLCRPGLLCEISKALRRWLGAQTHAGLAERRGTSLPCSRRDSGAAIRKRKGKVLTRNLGKFSGFPKVSRGRMDAGPVQILRPPPPGLRRLPLPGDVAGGRRSRHGSRLLPRAHSRQGGRNPRRSEPTKTRDPRRKANLSLSPKPLVRLKRLLSATAKLPLLRCEPKRQIKIWRHSLSRKSGSFAPALKKILPTYRCTHRRSSNTRRHPPNEEQTTRQHQRSKEQHCVRRPDAFRHSAGQQRANRLHAHEHRG